MEELGQKERIIDAEGKALGRICSQAAKILQGKESPVFRPNAVYPAKVKIVNASKIKISPKKLKEESFTSFSGYHSGLKKTSFGKIFSENPALLLRRAIERMLPKNKLQKIYLRKLIIEN